MMKRYKLITCLPLCLMLLLAACEHRPLVDLQETHYIRIYLDEQMLNLTCGFYDDTRLRPDWNVPAVMRVVLCDPETGRPVAERFLQTLHEDSRGHYFDGYVNVPAGTYHLMAYNYGTETTLVRDEEDFHAATAYTYPIAPHLLAQLPSVRALPDPPEVLYEPDPLLVAVQEDVRIRPTAVTDTLRNASGDYFTASSIVQAYYLQVGIKGIEYVSSAVSLLTGMASAATIHSGQMRTDGEALLYFDMHTLRPDGNGTDGQKDRSGETDEADAALLYATFLTFGKLPDVASDLKITFEFVTVDGRTQTETLDITPLFYTEEALLHRWILIDQVIEIEAPPQEGGGFVPGVDEWGDVEEDIVI